MNKYDHTSEVRILDEPASTYQAGQDLAALASMMITKTYIKYILSLSRINLGELIKIIPISIDTYKRKTEFGPNVTEKILEIQEVYERGLEVFGDDFYLWMDTPNVTLGGKVPKSLLSNSFGVRRLLDQIGRMQHGIFA